MKHHPRSPKQVLMLIPLAVALAACQSPRLEDPAAWMKVPPGLILLTPDQAAKHGLQVRSIASASTKAQSKETAQAVDASGVRLQPVIKAYTVARYVDPDDPDLLHESHLVYRLESSGGWALDQRKSSNSTSNTRVE